MTLSLPCTVTGEELENQNGDGLVGGATSAATDGAWLGNNDNIIDGPAVSVAGDLPTVTLSVLSVSKSPSPRINSSLSTRSVYPPKASIPSP